MPTGSSKQLGAGQLRVERERPDDAEATAQLAGVTGAIADLQQERAKPYAGIWVARAEAGVVGYVVCWHVADELQVVDLAVHASWRRRGVASALLGHLLQHARTLSCRSIQLEVRANNAAARALYAGLGFETTRRRPGYYGAGEHGRAEDGLELSKLL